METKEQLMQHLIAKYRQYLEAFDRTPDTILMQQAHYELIKDNMFVQSNFEVKFNYVPMPIIYKR